MKRDEKLRVAIDAEFAELRRRTFDELRKLNIEVPIVKERMIEGLQVQIEIDILESCGEHVHIMISADDGGFPRSIMPLTDSFIWHADGTVEGPAE